MAKVQFSYSGRIRFRSFSKMFLAFKKYFSNTEKVMLASSLKRKLSTGVSIDQKPYNFQMHISFSAFNKKKFKLTVTVKL